MNENHHLRAQHGKAAMPDTQPTQPPRVYDAKITYEYHKLGTDIAQAAEDVCDFLASVPRAFFYEHEFELKFNDVRLPVNQHSSPATIVRDYFLHTMEQQRHRADIRVGVTKEAKK